MLKKQSVVLTDLDIIRIWLAANKLTLNTTKTEFLLTGSRQRLSTLERNPVNEINQFPIKQVPTSKSLGVYIDGIFLVSVILTKSQRRLLLALVRFSVLGIFSLLRF